MSAPILNQPWEDVADDVTGAIEKAVQPLLKKAVDDIYGGLLDATQDYLRDNLAFNIASRIDCAEREATRYRQENAELLEGLEKAAARLRMAERFMAESFGISGTLRAERTIKLHDCAAEAEAAIAKARGGA